MSLTRKVGMCFSFVVAALALPMLRLTPSVAATQVSTFETEDAKQQIAAVLRAHEEYWNRHDMDTWADKILHEDSDWVSWRGRYLHGKTAIRDGHRAIHQTQYKNSRLSPQRVEDLTFLTADVAVAHVRSELSGDERAPGQTIPYRKTILFTKQHGVWRIRALHNTRLLDPEPSPR